MAVLPCEGDNAAVLKAGVPVVFPLTGGFFFSLIWAICNHKRVKLDSEKVRGSTKRATVSCQPDDRQACILCVAAAECARHAMECCVG